MANNPEATNLNGYYFKDLAGRELLSSESSERQTQFNTLQNQINSFISGGYVPYAVDSTSDMINTKRIYVLKSSGNWYYYDTDTSTWTVGGAYQANNNASTLTALRQAENCPVLAISSLTFMNGGVHQNTHHLTIGDSDRIRNRTLIHCKAGSVINFTGEPDYAFKLTEYSSLTKLWNGYIAEPVAFADHATTYTVTKDCYIVITIKKDDGTAIPEEDFETVAGYLSTSTIYLCEEPDLEGDITSKVGKIESQKWNSTGGCTDSDSYDVIRPFKVEAGDVVSVLKLVDSNDNTNLVIFNANQELITEYTGTQYQTTQSGNAYIVPTGGVYASFSVSKTDMDNTKVYRYKKQDSMQASIRLIKDGAGTKLIAHRGLEKFAPEATVPAYTIAGEKGMWGCKLDICETADGYFVMSHDTTIDRMFNGSGSISSMTYEQLLGYTVDAGNHIADYPNEKIVLLEDALKICKHYNMHPVIEFKSVSSYASIPAVLSIIESAGLLEQTLCQCSGGDRTLLSNLRQYNKDIPIIYWNSSMQIATIWHCPLALGNSVPAISAWNTQYNDPSILALVKSFGYPICVAVTDGDSALTKTNTAIANGAVYIVTDQITPEDIAPNTYTAQLYTFPQGYPHPVEIYDII